MCSEECAAGGKAVRRCGRSQAANAVPLAGDEGGSGVEPQVRQPRHVRVRLEPAGRLALPSRAAQGYFFQLKAEIGIPDLWPKWILRLLRLSLQDNQRGIDGE